MTLHRIVGSIPKGLMITSILLAIYIPINFVLFVAMMRDGSPTQTSTGYYLDNHGVYTPVTRDQYLRYQAYEVRGFSGHWMAFSLIPFVYWVFVFEKTEKNGKVSC